MLNTLNQKSDLNLLKSINALVGSNLSNMPGNIITGDVRIGGTNWKPELPNLENIEQTLKKLNENPNITRKSNRKNVLLNVKPNLLGRKQKNSNAICKQRNDRKRQRHNNSTNRTKKHIRRKTNKIL